MVALQRFAFKIQRAAFSVQRAAFGVQHLLPLLLYTALALLMTWPLAANFTTAAIGTPAVPGEVYDSWQYMWNLWWLKEALLHGHHPYFTPMIYYPHGVPLFLHTLLLSSSRWWRVATVPTCWPDP